MQCNCQRGEGGDVVLCMLHADVFLKRQRRLVNAARAVFERLEVRGDTGTAPEFNELAEALRANGADANETVAQEARTKKHFLLLRAQELLLDAPLNRAPAKSLAWLEWRARRDELLDNIKDAFKKNGDSA